MLINIVLSVLAYCLGPVIYDFCRQSKFKQNVLNGFICVSITGISLLHLFEIITYENIIYIIVVFTLGIFGPNYLEKVFSNFNRHIHKAVLGFSLFAFAVHVFLEGIYLHHSEELTHDLLAMGVLIHRIPVGIALWWIIRPIFGKKAAIASLVIISSISILGSITPVDLHHHETHLWIDLLKAFLAGSILHVVLFNSHLQEHLLKIQNEHSCCHKETDCCNEKKHFFEISGEGLGNLLALGVVGLMLGHLDAEEHLEAFILINQIYQLFIISSPALILGFTFAGLFNLFSNRLPLNWLNRGNRVSQSAKGMVFGLPLPICSCGVLPIYRTLVKKGMAPSVAIAFLIATPELGIDAVLISLPLLGFELTFYRVWAAVVFAILLAIFLGSKLKEPENEIEAEDTKKKSFWEDLTLNKTKQSLSYAFTDLFDSIMPWIVFGLLLAGFTEVILNDFSLSSLGYLDVLIASIVGIFFYVCATGATPFVAILVANGLSAGAAVAFLLTGPATNVSTFGVLSQLHSKKFAIIFAISAGLLAIAIGYSLNIFFDIQTINPDYFCNHQHFKFWHYGSAILLTGLLIISVLRNGFTTLVKEIYHK